MAGVWLRAAIGFLPHPTLKSQIRQGGFSLPPQFFDSYSERLGWFTSPLRGFGLGQPTNPLCLLPDPSKPHRFLILRSAVVRPSFPATVAYRIVGTPGALPSVTDPPPPSARSSHPGPRAPQLVPHPPGGRHVPAGRIPRHCVGTTTGTQPCSAFCGQNEDLLCLTLERRTTRIPILFNLFVKNSPL